MAAYLPIALGSGVRPRYMYDICKYGTYMVAVPTTPPYCPPGQCTLYSRRRGTHAPHILHLVSTPSKLRPNGLERGLPGPEGRLHREPEASVQVSR